MNSKVTENNTKYQSDIHGRKLLMHSGSYLFQCCLVLYKEVNIMGRMMFILSAIRLRMYSLFQ